MNHEKSCRAIVKERSQGACERCGKSWPPSTQHHRQKRSAGGRWCPTNIVAVCGNGTFPPDACHPFFEHHPAEAEAEGFHLRPWVKDPGAIPVLYRGRWAYLREDGSVEYTD